MIYEERIKKALEIAADWGMIDDAYHKMWVIDQMVRTLTSCPVRRERTIDGRGNSCILEYMGKSKEYQEWLQNGDGHDWDVGVAP